MSLPTASSLAAAEAPPARAGVGHYENFPVASWLCPPRLRPAVQAIYHFARTADDLADEGVDAPSERLQRLAAYRLALEHCLNDQPAAPGPWAPVFEALRHAVRTHGLPPDPLRDLLSAFEQDVRHTAAAHHYRSLDELLDYCARSACPVGRLLLHLYGVRDEASLWQSDQICSALQLVNFWQDLSVDLPRQRHYLPTDRLLHHGLDRAWFDRQPAAGVDRAAEERMARLLADLCDDARARMLQGAPLARRVPGRAGWELRLVVQGGLRILDHIAAAGHRSWASRPSLRAADLPVLLWRALRMP